MKKILALCSPCPSASCSALRSLPTPPSGCCPCREGSLQGQVWQRSEVPEKKKVEEKK